MYSEFDFKIATFGQRLIARIIDLLIILMFTFVIIVIFKIVETNQNNGFETILMLNILFYRFIYYPIMEYKGGTFGKRIIGIRTNDTLRNKKLTIWNSYKRAIFQGWALLLVLIIAIFDGVLFIDFQITINFLGVLTFVFIFISPFSMLWNKDKKTWYDQWADTIVVSRKIKESKLGSNITIQSNQNQVKKENNKNPYLKLIIVLVIIIILTLPFHYLPDHLMVFPKENMTFSNTFIFQSDVNKLIDRYNKANILEKVEISQEPLYKKLKEKGIIYNKEFDNKQEE